MRKDFFDDITKISHSTNIFDDIQLIIEMYLLYQL